MKVVVTGCSGFIGSHLCEQLLKERHEVVGLDLERSPNMTNLVHDANFKWLPVDLTDGNDYAGWFEGADTLVHLAARAGAVGSWSYFPHYLRMNVLATYRVLQAALKASVPHVILTSSSSVYGRVAVGNEQTPLRPCNPYGATKIAAEAICRAFYEGYGGSYTVIRPFSIYGPRQRPDMFHYIAIKALLRGEPLIIDGDGTQVRANTYVADLVQAFSLVISHPDESQGRTFNVGGGEAATLLETVGKLEKIVRRKAEIKFGPPRLGDQTYTKADTSAIYKALEWEPETSLDIGLRHQVIWQQSLGVG